jgi:hypothetical protein
MAREMRAVVIVTPAEGPSLGIEPWGIKEEREMERQMSGGHVCSGAGRRLMFASDVG